MGKSKEYPSTIELKDGTKVLAPEEFDSRRPDPEIFKRLEKERAHKGEATEPKK